MSEDFYKSQTAFSSETDMWSTPQKFFDEYNAIYCFNTDVCATKDDTKCEHYYDKEVDGLAQKWEGVCWMNPPYGSPEFPCKSGCKKKKCGERGYHTSEYVPGIIDWMRKAYEESLTGVTVVCLIPARTDTKWWHDYAIKGDIEFIRGRLKFGDSDNSAPFPSAVAIFN